MLEETIERRFGKGVYCDVPLGLYLVRGENIVILGEVVRGSAPLCLCVCATVAAAVSVCGAGGCWIAFEWADPETGGMALACECVCAFVFACVCMCVFL